MRYIVDRIEGHIAILEDENRNMSNVPLKVLPGGGVGKGLPWLLLIVNILLMKKSARQRNNKIKKMMDDLWE